jgi:hypothetical protein
LAVYQGWGVEVDDSPEHEDLLGYTERLDSMEGTANDALDKTEKRCGEGFFDSGTRNG